MDKLKLAGAIWVKGSNQKSPDSRSLSYHCKSWDSSLTSEFMKICECNWKSGKKEKYSPCFGLYTLLKKSSVILFRILDAGHDSIDRPHTISIEGLYLDGVKKLKNSEKILASCLCVEAWPKNLDENTVKNELIELKISDCFESKEILDAVSEVLKNPTKRCLLVGDIGNLDYKRSFFDSVIFSESKKMETNKRDSLKIETSPDSSKKQLASDIDSNLYCQSLNNNKNEKDTNSQKARETDKPTSTKKIEPKPSFPIKVIGIFIMLIISLVVIIGFLLNRYQKLQLDNNLLRQELTQWQFSTVFDADTPEKINKKLKELREWNLNFSNQQPESVKKNLDQLKNQIQAWQDAASPTKTPEGLRLYLRDIQSKPVPQEVKAIANNRQEYVNSLQQIKERIEEELKKLETR